MDRKKETIMIAVMGAVFAIVAALLTKFGNPANMGFCIACFIRDIAGTLKLHQAPVVQYMRPEIPGLIIGAFCMAFFRKESAARGGSNPLLRFVLGAFIMIGGLVFLGCPVRMMLRIGGGDFNAIIGLIGFAGGIFCGNLALKGGFSFDRAQILNKNETYVLPAIQVGLLAVAFLIPGLLVFSEEGPGSMRAPVILSLIAGLVIGALAQRTRFCTVAGIRDSMLLGDFTMLIGFGVLIAVSIVMNIALGKFNPGFTEQPIAHTDGVWNFLSMALVGFASTLVGGCPLRQLILAGEGNVDSGITIMGMLVGAALSHNFGMASSGEGTTPYGRIAVIVGLVVVVIIALINIKSNSNKRKEQIA